MQKLFFSQDANQNHQLYLCLKLCLNFSWKRLRNAKTSKFQNNGALLRLVFQVILIKKMVKNEREKRQKRKMKEVQKLVKVPE